MCIGVARGETGDHALPKFLAYLVILRFEKRSAKQTTVARLNSNILPPKIIFAP